MRTGPLGRLLGKQPERKFLALAVIFNLLCLGVFKYTGFLLENVYALAHIERAAPQIALPIGISFYTFQAMSYVIDVYRGQVGVPAVVCEIPALRVALSAAHRRADRPLFRCGEGD